MRRWISLTLLVVVSLVLESTVFHGLTIGDIRPDLVLVLVIFFALFSGPAGGAFFGFLGGLAQDCLTGHFLGLNALTKLAVAYTIARLERKMHTDYPIIVVFTVFVLSVFNEILVYLLAAPFVAQPAFTGVLLKIILPAAVYNSVIAGLTFNRFRRSITKGLLQPTDY